MAAEAPASAAPPLPIPEKRVAPEDVGEEEEERPGSKRRRAFVAALDGVPCAAPADAEGGGQRDGASFSFEHALGGFVALETTPKFGSFNPPAAAEQQEALDPKPAPSAAEDPPVVEEEGEEEEEEEVSAHGVGDREDGNSPLVAAAVGDQGEPGRQNESDGDLHLLGGVLVDDSY